jgi:hypothetical protein
MHCTFCHTSPILFNLRKKERKRVISYYEKNGVTTLTKHVDADHALLAKKFEEEVDSPMTIVLEKELGKKKFNVSIFELSKFFGVKVSFKKDVVLQKRFMQDLGLFLIKNHQLIQFVEVTWLKHLAMHIIIHLCSKVVFLSRKWFSQEVLPDLVEETKQEYVLPKFLKCHSTIANFDTWMS